MDQPKQNEVLLEQVQKLINEVQELKKEIQAKDARIGELESMNKYLTAKLYASKSEKVDPNQLSLLDDDSVFSLSEHTDEQSTEETKTEIKNTKKKKQTRQEQIAGLPVKEKIYTLDKPFCPKGHELKKIGKKLVGDKLHFQPAKLWVEKIYSTTYKCERCIHDEVQASSIRLRNHKGYSPIVWLRHLFLNDIRGTTINTAFDVVSQRS